jgi:hypothetical protein
MMINGLGTKTVIGQANPGGVLVPIADSSEPPIRSTSWWIGFTIFWEAQSAKYD